MDVESEFNFPIRKLAESIERMEPQAHLPPLLDSKFPAHFLT